MEEALLRDPAFWTAEEAVAPGAVLGREALALPELAGMVLFRTSGSSGEPKWIAHRRDGLLVSAAMVNRHLAVDESACWGLALPLHHVGGFGVVARAFESGCRMAVYGGKWDAERFRVWIEAEGVSHVSLVPTQVRDLVNGGLAAPDCLRVVVVGGGRLENGDGRAARRLGWPVLASYGMTEAGSQVATQPVELLEVTYSEGPMPVLGHWEAGIGKDERIRLRGPSLFCGWLQGGPGDWRFEAREGEWFVSSDRGRLEDERLWVLGRVDDRVKIFGELVDPGMVERALGIEGLVVVALPEVRAGHRLVAVWEGERIPEGVAKVVADHDRSCEGFLRIGEIRRVGKIPRSDLGKVLRGSLLERIREGRI